nr:MAG TPA: cell division protein [Bacteriophage sp.]
MVIVTINGKEVDVESLELPEEVLQIIAEVIDSK